MISSYYHGASLKLTYSSNKIWKRNAATYLELSSISEFPRPGSQVCSKAYMDAPFWLVGYSYLPRLSYPSLLMIINKRVHVYFIVNSYCVTQVIFIRKTCLAGSRFSDGGVTLTSGPTFLHFINSLSRPVVTTLTKRDNQSTPERCCHWQN